MHCAAEDILGVGVTLDEREWHADSAAAGSPVHGVAYRYRRVGASVGTRPLVLLQHFRGNLTGTHLGQRAGLSSHPRQYRQPRIHGNPRTDGTRRRRTLDRR